MFPVCPSLLKDPTLGGRKDVKVCTEKSYSTFLEGFLSLMRTLGAQYIFVYFTSRIIPTILMHREDSFVQGTFKYYTISF